MMDHAGGFYILNGNVQDPDTFKNLVVTKEKVVYEVLRAIEGKPLFFEDHYLRMKKSLDLIGVSLNYTQDELRAEIKRLTDENSQPNCNIKVMVYEVDGIQRMLTYISKSYYPGRDEMDRGVPVSLLEIERENPNAKVVNHQYKERVGRKIEEEGVFEFILVNQWDYMTEGSRSNLFFIRGSKAYTAPGEHVLKGITRQYVMEACHRAGVELVEELVDIKRLEEMDALFLSGTSIKVLPVSRVDQRMFSSSSNETVIAIRDEYDRLIEEYLKGN